MLLLYVSSAGVIITIIVNIMLMMLLLLLVSLLDVVARSDSVLLGLHRSARSHFLAMGHCAPTYTRKNKSVYPKVDHNSWKPTISGHWLSRGFTD